MSAASEPKLPPLKAEALRDQTLGAPGLAALDPQATLIVFAAALLAESEDGYTPEAAAGILLRARKVTLEMLLAAVQQVTQQLGAAMAAFWNSFVAATWEGSDKPPYVDPGVVARRKEAEEQEQERNRQSATQYLSNAQTAIGVLTIDDKEFPHSEPPPAPKAPRIDVGRFFHNLIYKPAAPPPGAAAKAAPGWLTPPLINPRDENVTIFDHDIMEIVGTRKLAGEQAWKKLEDRGYDRRRIVLAIDGVRKIAQAQIAQCDQILAFIRSDYEQHIEPVVKAAAQLGHAVSVVNTFYAPPAPAPVVPPPRPGPARGRTR
ncbi:MAG: hypothetical protein HZB53_11550 [Chloroflexi bacterium]|nr:hypothetical protein [Chloroflexota bacterium]